MNKFIVPAIGSLLLFIPFVGIGLYLILLVVWWHYKRDDIVPRKKRYEKQEFSESTLEDLK